MIKAPALSIQRYKKQRIDSNLGVSEKSSSSFEAIEEVGADSSQAESETHPEENPKKSAILSKHFLKIYLKNLFYVH